MGSQCIRSVEDVGDCRTSTCTRHPDDVTSTSKAAPKITQVSTLAELDEKLPSVEDPLWQPLSGISNKRGVARSIWPLGLSRPPKLELAKTPVNLHIYNIGNSSISNALNQVLQPLGTGIFHCGVEVFNTEWSFSDTSNGKGDGVFCSEPKCCEGHSYCQSLYMGETVFTEDDVTKLIAELKLDWPVSKYHTLKRNCCHFSDELCKRLGVGPIPSFLTNLAGAGAALASGHAPCCQKASIRCICCGETCGPLVEKDAEGGELVEVIDQLPVLKTSGGSRKERPSKKRAAQ